MHNIFYREDGVEGRNNDANNTIPQRGSKMSTNDNEKDIEKSEIIQCLHCGEVMFESEKRHHKCGGCNGGCV